MIITAFSNNYKKTLDFHYKVYINCIFIPVTIPLMSVIIAFCMSDMTYVSEISTFMERLFNSELNSEKWIWAIVIMAVLINTIKLKRQIRYRKICTLQAIQIACDLIEKDGLDNEAIRMLSNRRFPKNLGKG